MLEGQAGAWPDLQFVAGRQGDEQAGGDQHAGTRRDASGAVLSSGGRVLSATAGGTDLTAARSAAYALVAKVGMRGAQYRSDIGADADEGLVRLPPSERH